MEVERASLCNCVVNFLLEEKYLLTAFELLHELVEDGRDDHAIRLKEYFSDPSLFPPSQIAQFSSLRVADPQSLFEEIEETKEKLALSEYEHRLAQEDIAKLKEELEKRIDLSKTKPNVYDGISPIQDPGSALMSNSESAMKCDKVTSFADLGPLKDYERRDLNCALKDYLLLAGYKLTAMTFCEEASEQDLNDWKKSPAYVPDALRHYYYQYISSTNEAAEEKIAMLQENDALRTQNEKKNEELSHLKATKDLAETEILELKKTLEALQKDIKERENQEQESKQSLEFQRKELNDCRSHITTLKMLLAEYLSKSNDLNVNADDLQLQTPASYGEKKGKESSESNSLVSSNAYSELKHSINATNEPLLSEEKTIEGDDVENRVCEQKLIDVKLNSFENDMKGRLLISSDDITVRPPDNIENWGLDAIQILSDCLPKIVPYVLINHREELLPLIMCAIERHPESATRDSLTNTLFNLIKRPDEQQRRIIMDACVTLAKNVGEMRTETELLPQCWEQISHIYEERRFLVAQSCGELAEFVRPEIRDSLILSIVQQLVEDSSPVVRVAAAHNLSLLLPLFPNSDKYFKVEELMFQLVCDPSGLVLDTTLKELVPAVIKWGKNLDHILRTLLSHILTAAHRCSPLSGVENSLESHLLNLGERERWNIDVLLRMLLTLVPFIHHHVVSSAPLPFPAETENPILPPSSLQQYAAGEADWPALEWLHADCFPDLIHLSTMLPPKEENLRSRIAKFLVALGDQLGDSYVDNIMLPVFLVAVGDVTNLNYFFPSDIISTIQGLKPKTLLNERLATMCVLPLLLAGVLGPSSKREELSNYLRNLLIGRQSKHELETIQAVRFLCIFESNHSMIFTILWEMVASSDPLLKSIAATILKAIVPYCDAKSASSHVLPVLVTLGSDQNLAVKHASIDAFGAVAQHFKTDSIVDKIRTQMDTFLEDGSHEATLAVVRALTVAAPATSPKLRDYLLAKIYVLSATPAASSDTERRRERADALAEGLRALDACDVGAGSVREYLVPAAQNLLREGDALDPAHKEALEIVVRERSGGALDAISKAMGAHLGMASGLFGKKDGAESGAASEVAVVEDTRFKRIMRGNFADMLRTKTGLSGDDPSH